MIEGQTKGKLRYKLDKLRRTQNTLEVEIRIETFNLMQKHLRLIKIKAELKTFRQIKRDALAKLAQIEKEENELKETPKVV